MARARACLGTRFVWQGRLPGVGLDCIGLVLAAAADASLNALDQSDYDLGVSPERLASVLETSALRETTQPSPGDVLLLRVRAVALHLAIHAGPTMIHADMRLRRVVEHRIDGDWAQRIVQAYRLPGVM